LLVYLDPDVIKKTKKSALDLDTTASAIVEEALLEWQNRRKATAADKEGAVARRRRPARKRERG
jgi:hypothetical protein